MGSQGDFLRTTMTLPRKTSSLRNTNKHEHFMSGMLGLIVRDSGFILAGNLLLCAGVKIILHIM